MNSQQRLTTFSEVITPNHRWFKFNLREVWRYRDLVMLFVRRDFVAQYKQTILGPLWIILQPLLTTFVFYVVFSKIAKISTNGSDPFLFYLSGITLWNYFSDCLTKTSNTFVANAGIFGKVYFPRLVLPISIILSNLIKLGIQILLLLSVILFRWSFQGLTPEWNFYILMFPLLILILAILSLGFGLIFSSFTTKYRDLAYLLTFATQLLMFATPILYPLNFTQGFLAEAIALNPLTPIFETFRFTLFTNGNFDQVGLLYAFGLSVCCLMIGIMLFNKVERSFMDTV